MSSIKVLLLGGTGAMGKPLADILINRGHTVYVTTRKNRVSTNEQLIYLQGNAHESEFLSQISKMFYFDAVVDFMVYHGLEFKNNYEQLLTLGKHYVFLSSSRVYSNSSDFITECSSRHIDNNEDRKFVSSDEYAISKGRDENILMNGKYNSWTIIRPYITYFDNRLQLGTLEKEKWLYRALDGRKIVFSKDIGEKYTTMTCGMDVAECIAEVLGKDVFWGEIYNPVTNESIKWKDVLQIYLRCIKEVTGKTVDVVWVETCHDMGISSYQTKYDRLYDRCFDNQKILEEIKKTDFISVEKGIESCVRSFIENNMRFGKISFKIEARYDKISSETISLRKIPTLKEKIVYLWCRHFK